MAKRVRVANFAQVQPGTCLSVEVDGYGVALFNVEGTIYALDNVCPHAGGPLGEGSLQGSHVTCPWHGWRFNVCTGARPENPVFTVSRYRVEVADGDIFVSIPPETEGARP